MLEKIKNLLNNLIQKTKLKYLKWKFKNSTQYSIGYILSIVPKDQIVRKPGKSKKRKGKYIILDNRKIRCYSRKFYFFQKEYEQKHKIICPVCGLKADYFRIVPTGSFDDKNKAHYTFNLFGIKNDKQILFDIDHIHPIARGGKNIKNNLRILCHECNNSKADKLN